ncbi:hypothetical protein J2Z28_005743 [Paenibacillus xylanexedens]|uniref:Uncharacterized protein n=1 Tax=Paenibacillus xylanexedens TaxID=528191 RepID=A0ABS4S1Z6_PAEXY|nr:hypothetical protein [Paenibacillus xylanexedens]
MCVFVKKSGMLKLIGQSITKCFKVLICRQKVDCSPYDISEAQYRVILNVFLSVVLLMIANMKDKIELWRGKDEHNQV